MSHNQMKGIEIQTNLRFFVGMKLHKVFVFRWLAKRVLWGFTNWRAEAQEFQRLWESLGIPDSNPLPPLHVKATGK